MRITRSQWELSRVRHKYSPYLAVNLKSLEFDGLTIGIKIVDILMLETPRAICPPNMWLEGEARHTPQRPMIIGLDEQAAITLAGDTVAQVTKKVQILKTFG